MNLNSYFPHSPTTDQSLAIGALESFLVPESEQRIFLLKGYAGTGKTTILASLANALLDTDRGFALLAPTGRAAKVISKHSSINANTIHSFLYRPFSTETGGVFFALRDIELAPGTVLIVDEASMISSQPSDPEDDFQTPNSVLDDLFTVLKRQEDAKIIFIGDLAQLPPVKEALSVALDGKALKERFGLSFMESDLKQVTRQAANSGPLVCATYVRQMINTSEYQTKKAADSGHGDLLQISSSNLLKQIAAAYSEVGQDNVAIVCNSNRKAVEYNLQIRRDLLDLDGQLAVGERVMVVKNYHRDPFLQEMGIHFLANGEIVLITSLGETYQQGEYQFQRVGIEIEHLDGSKVEISVLANLSTLTSHTARFPSEGYQNLRKLRLKEYTHLPPDQAREALREDPFLNAVQIKYGYAFTCHKSQGGQWNHVFVDHENIFHFHNKEENHRWFYTAITRTAGTLSLINFPKAWIHKGVPESVEGLIAADPRDQQEAEMVRAVQDPLREKESIPVEEPLESATIEKPPDSSSTIHKIPKPVLQQPKTAESRVSISIPIRLPIAIGILLLIIGVFWVGRQSAFFAGDQVLSGPTDTPFHFVTSTASPTLLPSETPSATPKPLVSGCVNVEELRIRSAPTINSRLLGGLVFDTCLEFDAISEDGDWLRIQPVPGETEERWVFLPYIDLENDANSLPTILP
ncbi:MAG: DUF2075 domain-containing protein [Chloroflexi bacterium]|nr:MAG: DUF2075 domain-containing protein [Chloroflexota bacterium]MBL1195154.1 DUF2075 domain-containing protein [Chloroflexota bacterium]NOH12439.1 AAA family ATPase [Chloroflexota bacterium]